MLIALLRRLWRFSVFREAEEVVEELVGALRTTRELDKARRAAVDATTIDNLKVAVENVCFDGSLSTQCWTGISGGMQVGAMREIGRR